MEGERKKFSAVGMRVLAVDDNLTCLKVLEAMLRKCEYHVTTSNQAVEALKMLRENKDKFDLIITDVHMPDMDGFKLLELVGLEMDLPVIMLSANGDREFVMKGVTHGACDYLLKPVRMEQLKNIWQHVVRKMNSVAREQNRSNNAAEGHMTRGSSEHKQSRKREDRNEEGEDSDENSDDIGSATGQKKARVKWSGDMHRKFVAAVNQMGIDKAQPKAILKLMNVEGLRRQNVGSHLQKYRLALRKMASEEEKKSYVEGVRDSYLPLPILDNYRNFQPFTSSNQLSVLPCVQYNGAMRRRQPTLVGHDNVSPGIPQATRTHSTRCLNLSGLQNITGTQQENFLQRLPATMEVSQLQLHRRIQEAGNNFPGSVSVNSVTNNPLMLQSQQNSMNAGNSSRFPERYNETLQSDVALVGCSANTLPVSVGFSPSFSQMNSNPMDFSLSSSLVAPLSDLVTGNALDMQNGLFSECSRYMSYGSDQQQWAECIQVHAPVQNNVFSSTNPPLADQFIGDVTSQSQRVISGKFVKKPANINGQMNYSTIYLPQQCKTDKPIAEDQVKYKDEFFLEASTIQGRLSSGGYGLDEIVMTKSGFVDV